MIRDRYLKVLFIPLLGIFIPVLSGIITYSRYRTTQIIGINFYFIFSSLLIWSGSNWVHIKLRPIYKPGVNPFIKIATLTLLSILLGMSIGGITAMIWYKFSFEIFSWVNLIKFLVVCALAIILFTLIYEILFLSKERELDSKIVKQLDHELTQAEMSVLKNELDPHFLFNSLTTLSHLILNDPATAHAFNSKLSSVYKYFLLNKERELISLDDELEFIENYFFLLKIRHDNKLELQTELKGHDGKIMILPCALQILIENAVKHNEFTEANPLKINISRNGQYLKITNTVKLKPYLVNSTGIGLKNLSSRYRLISNKDIVIENFNNRFSVKLPLIE
ncbi:MAG: histidine kinase [Bacteroidetes bacterium]|nr:histidine kinase [Bacteroidota bacterium]MBS1932118.1 histidine kinase [Bacteroidota bacterium]